VGTPVNVPGIPFGAAAEDPTTLYLADYFWNSQLIQHSKVTVCKLAGGHCSTQGSVTLGGQTGPVFVENGKAYLTSFPDGGPLALHQIDLTNPQTPIDNVLPVPVTWFGSLLSVSGDEAFFTSGWGDGSEDLYLLNGAQQPVYQGTSHGSL
jgi:hypothetical protein